MFTRKNLLPIASVLIVCTAFMNLHQDQSDASIPYPEGYRTWTHVSSAIIGPNSPAFGRFGGIHHIYANDKAMRGFALGKFPEGSVLVFDLLEMKEEQGTISAGERKVVDVMVKDSNRYDSTGGWGYQEFKGSTREITLEKLSSKSVLPVTPGRKKKILCSVNTSSA